MKKSSFGLFKIPIANATVTCKPEILIIRIRNHLKEEIPSLKNPPFIVTLKLIYIFKYLIYDKNIKINVKEAY